MWIIIFVVCSFIFNTTYVHSQILNNKGTQVILKGKVTDEYTGEPVSVNIEFRGPNDKKIRIVSNSKDGSYQQVLTAGEEYEVIFTNYDIIRKKEKLILEDFGEYKEITKNFTVKRLVPGKKVYEIQAFDVGSDKLNQIALNLLEELQEFMKFNRGVTFDIFVTGDNHYTAPKQITPQSQTKDKKQKKDKKQQDNQEQKIQTKPSFEKNYALAEKRALQVKNQINTWQRFQNRIEVKTDLEAGNTKPLSYNFIVVVNKVEKH